MSSHNLQRWKVLDPEAATLVPQAFYPFFCTVALILLLNRTVIRQKARGAQIDTKDDESLCP
jgi:hypothetical protein